MPVGSGGFVSLVKVGKKYFLIGVSKESINCIAEIDSGDIPEDTEEKPKFSFEKYFQQCYNKFKTNNEKEGDKGDKK